MKTLDMSNSLLNLDGNPVLSDGKELSLARVLANALVSSDSQDPVKFYDWAMKLVSDGFIMVDESDLKKLTDFIKTAKLTVLAKGALLKTIS